MGLGGIERWFAWFGGGWEGVRVFGSAFWRFVCELVLNRELEKVQGGFWIGNFFS